MVKDHSSAQNCFPVFFIFFFLNVLCTRELPVSLTVCCNLYYHCYRSWFLYISRKVWTQTYAFMCMMSNYFPILCTSFLVLIHLKYCYCSGGKNGSSINGPALAPSISSIDSSSLSQYYYNGGFVILALLLSALVVL